MATLLYSPGLRILIQTAGNGIIDVTEDVTDGTLTITENAPSQFSFTLLNHRRKYDGVFTPNDTISVRMKRITWMPVFSGYLNQVPYYSVYPRNINLTATDTLKRLKYRLWDPGTVASVNLLNTAAGKGEGDDGGMRNVMMSVLTKVAKWPEHRIHIGGLPDDWYERMEPLHRKVMNEIGEGPGRNAVVRGRSPGEGGGDGGNGGNGGGNGGKGGGKRRPEKRDPVEDDLPGSATVLPKTSAKATIIGGPGWTGEMALSGESRSRPRDQWYLAMRWPYADDTGTKPRVGLSDGDFRKARGWWAGRLMVVTNPKNFRSIVVRVADWGPSLGKTVIELGGGTENIDLIDIERLGGYEMGLSEHALFTGLGARNGDRLEVLFAPEGATLGPQARPQAEVAPRTVAAKTIPGGETGGSGGGSGGNGGGGTGGGGGDAGSQPDVGKLPWYPADNLESNTNAARAFIQANWHPLSIGGYRVSNIAGTNTPSDHQYGLALDNMVAANGTIAVGDGNVKGNSIAKWFAANPNVFGTKYVIWKDKICDGGAWRAYGSPGRGNTLQHRDHVHVSFLNNNKTSPGPMGGGWTAGTDANFNANFSGGFNGASVAPGGSDGGVGSVGGGGGEGSSAPLTNLINWNPHPSTQSEVLAGYRALMNDTPVLNSLSQMCQASMRSFMAAPNGDFVAWFPDYFGTYGTAAKMQIRDIEVYGDGFTMMWDDSRMVTHQFTAGSSTGYDQSLEPNGEAVTIFNQIQTHGIASVEFPELMQALFNIDKKDPRAKSFLDPEAILKRFGARVNYQPMGFISSREAEFWYACRLFQQNWAAQFSSQINLTFMPEIWPGMLIKMATFGFQAYVEQVTHSFSFADGGSGFQTSVRVIAPSATDGSGLYGLPNAGSSIPMDGSGGGKGGGKGGGGKTGGTKPPQGGGK